MPQTDTETRNPFVGWWFHDRKALVKALDEYAKFRGDAGPQRGGGSEGEQDPYTEQLKRNAAIDKAMARLHHWHKLSHRLIDAYYRTGLNYEHDGWSRAMDRISNAFPGLFYHTQTQRERERQSKLFDMLISQAVDSLFNAHCVQPQRNIGDS